MPSTVIRYEIRTSGFPSGWPSFFRHFILRRPSTVILLVIFCAYLGQLMAQAVLDQSYYIPGDYSTFLYYLAPSRATAIARPWTLLTSIFLHAGFTHLLVNGIALFFFGPMLEMRIGRKRFLHIFLGAGVLASAAQLLVIPSDIVVLGASGAILGALGTLTVLAPRLPVLLFFLIPMQLWMVTLGFGAISAILAFSGPLGSIAHTAHLSGLVVGLAYGYKARREGRKSAFTPFGSFLCPLL